MVQCFVPDCNHQSERDKCTHFFRIPINEKETKRWLKLIRREDREPNHSSRVCSCHFKDSEKKNGPEIFERNVNKLFPTDTIKPIKRRKLTTPESEYLQNETGAVFPVVVGELPSTSTTETTDIPSLGCQECKLIKTENLILQCDNYRLNQDLKKNLDTRKIYSSENLSSDVLCMETGLPNKDIFNVVVQYTKRFQGSLSYFAGWNVEMLLFEDQILMTLMKIKQNYTNLHLAQLFNCSTATVRNVVLTFIHVLYEILYIDLMSTVPTREKNMLSLPQSFSNFQNCRMVIDCTDVEIACPSLMSDQKLTYSTYRGMNSFKVLIGVAPNAVITYVSNLYPGSTSDKVVVSKSGILSHFTAGDLILADKGFLIQGIVPQGVSVNIPPFLSHGKLTESEARVTKEIAKCRIHVERVNSRLKDFKILRFIPAYLRCYSEKIIKLCAALVNLQNPLIKQSEACMDFD